MRSRSQEKSKAPDLSNNLAEVGVDREKKRTKKKKQMEKTPVNEFSRIRTHLRYLLHRIKYEQNFIDAYSGEGWKGQSLEKIKPEKELQRAKSEIFRRKLKIRDLFQRLDLSCAEGRLPEALFDSEGEIDSEDIFCAKCGSKDVAINNDIILCDGACERGFHQFCLEPPLLKEYIPPDDEGWLCPGCDCKVDCIELLNDSQGTKISVGDSWEKVFPEEAAAAAAGNKLDDNFGLPSDDSEDDDYDPDGPELDEKVQGDESSSDESDYYSASDDVGALPNNEQTLGLPSDDSEDDDYDPSGLDPDQELIKESSSSDFTSDSEDFSVAFDENEPSGEVQGPITSTLNHIKINEEKCGQSETKRHSLSDELLSLLESESGQGYSGSLYPKRHVERLDYKKLHDEEYGNTSSDSSDEDFVDTALPKRRRTNSGKATLVSPNGETPTVKHGKDATELEPNQKDGESTHKRRTGKKFDVEGTDSPPARSRKDSSAPGSSGRSTTKSTYAEDVTQILFKYFKENQYPERAVKENLARELALTVQQVSKWFENARWSSRHSSHMTSSVAETASNKGTPAQKNKKLDGSELKLLTEDATCNGVEKNEQAKASPSVIECCSGGVKLNMDTEEDNGQNSSISKSKKRKAKFDSRVTVPNTNTEETPKQSAEVNSPKTRGRKSSRIQSNRILRTQK